MDVFMWAPEGFTTWLFQQDKHPRNVKIRENTNYGREVAGKLVEEKRQELRDGTSRRDVLSLLGLSCIPFVELDT